METLFVNFKGSSSNSKNRIDEILKPIYWTDAPENWSDFDGEITTYSLQDRGGDYVKIQIDSTSKWFNWITNELIANKYKFGVTDIEIKVEDSFAFEFAQNWENQKKTGIRLYKGEIMGTFYSLLS